MTLASDPKALAPDAAELAGGKALTKKKSVMGRLKSKISTTLGRKKSLADMSPTDKDVAKTTSASAPAAVKMQPQSSEPETRSDRDDKDRVSSSSFVQQQHERDDDHGVHQLRSMVAHAAIEPFDAKHIDDDDDDDNETDHNGDESSSSTSGSDTGRSEEKPPAPAASLQQQQREHGQENADEEVFASDYKSGAGAENDYSDDDDEDDDEEEKLEVFDDNDAGNQTHASREHRQHHREQHNEPETQAGPDTMDLVVVGLSPLKLTRPMPQPSSAVRTATAPSPVSPVAKAQPLESPRRSVMEYAPPQEAPVATQQRSVIATTADEPQQSEAQSLEPKRRGGIKVDLEQDDDARDSNSATSTLERPVLKAPPQFSSSRGGPPASKKIEQPVAPASPEKPPRLQLQTQPLLSDFHFGSELGPTAVRSSALDSPAKRRGAISMSTLSPSSTTSVAAAVMPSRKSFARDQEQQLAMASPKKKVTMARSSMALSKASGAAATGASGSSTILPSDLPREALEGIQEETKRPSSPRKTSVSRRRSSSMMEAPILASSFIASASAAVDDPASHDDDTYDSLAQLQGGASSQADTTNDTEDASHDAATAFAFDAAAAIVQEFGERVARLLSAEPWGDRQDGFDAIQYIVKKADLSTTKTKRELFCAALAAIQGGVDDRVAPVMYCALECLRTVLKEFAPVVDRTFLRYAPMNEQLSALVKSLVGKLGDSNKRTQRETSQALLRVTKQKKLKALPHVLLHLSAKEVAPRLQVETLRQLVSALGVDSKNGLSLGVAMQFAIPALKVADEKTRKAAVELIADLHMLNGEAVNAQLVGTKPEMLRVINRRVDELLAKREKEKEAAAQSVNQTEDGASGGDDDLEKGAELVAVPAEEAKKTVALLEAQVLQAASVIGPVAWRKLESKTWSDRKEALVDIEKVMTEAKSDLRDAKPVFGSVIQLNFLAYCVTVHKCLGDSIAPVVNSAMDCLSTLIKVFGPCVEWREESVRDVVLLTIMRLFSTMQKPNSRTNRAACRSILKFARLTNAHTLRYTLSCIFAKETDALVQMHLLRLLIPEFGFQPDGISAALVLTAVGAALVHANDKVRKTAIDVALCTQRLVGKEYVLKKLKDVKPVTLKELEKNFVECDVKKDSDRPQTVHMSTSGATSDAGLPPVHFGGGENARRLLNSAPVGVGKLYCTPSSQDDDAFGGSTRRGSVLSNEEENFMDSILDGDL